MVLCICEITKMNKFKYLILIHRTFSFTPSLKRPTQEICKTKKAVKPLVSTTDSLKEPSDIKVDYETINLLERLSLVDCASGRGIETLEAAIHFADQIMQVDVANTQPLITVLEDISLITREDKITDGNIQEEILKNASLTEDGYFITPPGNVVLEVKENVNDS